MRRGGCPAVFQTAYYVPMSFGPPACEGGHSTDCEKGREREKEKDSFCACTENGTFHFDRKASAGEPLAVPPCRIVKISNVRTEGVGGRSGMGTPAVVCFTTPYSYSKNYAGENVPGMIE